MFNNTYIMRSLPPYIVTMFESCVNELDPVSKTGRPRIKIRDSLNGIFRRLRTGMQYNELRGLGCCMGYPYIM